MRGVILAGGTGSRLRPITNTGPKQLVPIANKPVLEYAVEDLREAGVDDIGVILGNKGREEIQETLGDGSRFGVDITYIVQGNPLGLAHAVGCARDFVGDERFVVYLGDNILEASIEPFVEDFRNGGTAAVLLQQVDDPQRFGIADVRPDGTVAELVEKPENPPSDLALVGVYAFDPVVFDVIEDLDPSWRGELEITDAIQQLLVDGGSIRSSVVDGWWKDTGKPGDVVHANQLVLEDRESDVRGTISGGASVDGTIELGEGSVVEADAVIEGPVSIGDRTRIGAGAHVGPGTSVGDDCRIERGHLESSVVCDGVDIECDRDRTIVDSLIDERATIRSNGGREARFVAGKHSTLVI